MIGILFTFGNDIVEVRIDGYNVYFRNSAFGGQFATIEGINLDYTGVIREFPDLKDNQLWRQEAIQRFKEKIKAMKNETEISNYIMEDLKLHGYQPMFRQRRGFRPEKL